MQNGNQRPGVGGRRPPSPTSQPTQPRPSYANTQNRQPPGRQHPMTEREYMAYQQRQQATAAQRQHRREVEQLMRKQETKRRRKRSREIFLGRLAVFAVVLLILLALCAGIFFMLFYHTPDAVTEKKISYSYGGETVRTVPVEEAYIHGVWYFCFQDLASYLNMVQTGSADELRFLFVEEQAEDDSRGDGQEEYVRFPVGESTAIVNGQSIPLDGTNHLNGNEIWVSVDFVTEVMENIDLQIAGDTIKMAKVLDAEAMEQAEDKKLLLYLDPAFRLKDTEPLDPVPEEGTYLPNIPDDGDEIDMELANVTFVNDLTAYEQFMAPENRDEYLILVNAKNPLSDSYVPTDLIDAPATAPGRNAQQMRQYAAKALEALLIEMKSAGFTTMQVNSGFRTYSYQAVLFETYTNNEMRDNPSLTREQAEAIALTYSTRPGTSEHQTGLAVDMAIDASFSTDFQYTPEYQWLAENAWKFGFVLRFPADKTEITTIQFEPWHWRYVGRYHAKKIHDAGVCLEEYIAMLSEE